MFRHPHVMISHCSKVSVRHHTANAFIYLILRTELLKEYRRLDDAIPMRLNRTNAAMRDKQRSGDQALAGNVQDEACAYLWRELVG
jgi:hypothetical protein